MKLKYIIPVAVALGLIAFLNFGMSTSKKLAPDAGVAPVSPPMAAGKNLAPLNFDSLVTIEKMKLTPQMQTNMSLLENNIARSDTKKQQVTDYESLGKLWLQTKRNNTIAAHYIGLSGKLENSEKKLNFAADLLYGELNNSEDLMPRMKNWMENEAIEYYKASLNVNPLNDSVKLNLATVYFDANQPMSCVQQLLAVVGRDSTNLRANIMLGKMSVQSGQLNKAIERGNTVLRVDPNNIDARLFMGEAYKRKGDKKKAIQLFTEAKKLMNNPAFSKDIDAYIATF